MQKYANIISAERRIKKDCELTSIIYLQRLRCPHVRLRGCLQTMDLLSVTYQNFRAKNVRYYYIVQQN